MCRQVSANSAVKDEGLTETKLSSKEKSNKEVSGDDGAVEFESNIEN